MFKRSQTEGEGFGEIALLRDACTATVRTTRKTRLLALDRDCFIETVTDARSHQSAKAVAAGWRAQMPWADPGLRVARRTLVPMTRMVEIETLRGTGARASSSRRRPLRGPRDGPHGAGGGVGAPDLLAARDAALDQGERRPRRAALSRRREALPTRRKDLDEAWIAVVEHLRASELGLASWITGGRRHGARSPAAPSRRPAPRSSASPSSLQARRWPRRAACPSSTP